MSHSIVNMTENQECLKKLQSHLLQPIKRVFRDSQVFQGKNNQSLEKPVIKRFRERKLSKCNVNDINNNNASSNETKIIKPIGEVKLKYYSLQLSENEDVISATLNTCTQIPFFVYDDIDIGFDNYITAECTFDETDTEVDQDCDSDNELIASHKHFC